MITKREFYDGIAFYKRDLGEIVFYNYITNTLDYQRKCITIEDEDYIHKEIRNFRRRRELESVICGLKDMFGSKEKNNAFQRAIC